MGLLFSLRTPFNDDVLPIVLNLLSYSYWYRLSSRAAVKPKPSLDAGLFLIFPDGVFCYCDLNTISEEDFISGEESPEGSLNI